MFTASGAAYTHSAVTATRRRSAMASVAELADEDARRRLAGPIEYRQGVDLAVGGCVRLASLGSVPVTARVEDLIFQHVELRSTGTGLGWSCTRRDGRTPAALHAQRRRRRGDPAAHPVPATLNVRVAARRLAQRSAVEPMTASPTQPHRRRSVLGVPPPLSGKPLRAGRRPNPRDGDRAACTGHAP